MSENKYCGNCHFFTNEDIGGEGLCSHFPSPFVTLCGRKGCKYHVKRKQILINGWTKITPDNVDELYLIRERTVIYRNHLKIYPQIDIASQFTCETLSLFAQMGGYYYFVLPELKIGE